MSIESLIANNLDSIRSEQKKAELQTPRSIVSIIAQAYINQGKERIVELSKNLSGMESTSISQKEFSERLQSQDLKSAKLSQIGIFMGICLQTIENMLINRAFSTLQMIENYNNVTIGTPLEKEELGDKEPMVKLSSEMYAKMIAKSKEDQSLGIFFEQPELLPKEFLQIIGSSVVEKIKVFLLPSYREQYRILSEERKTSQPNSQSKKS